MPVRKLSSFRPWLAGALLAGLVTMPTGAAPASDNAQGGGQSRGVTPPQTQQPSQTSQNRLPGPGGWEWWNDSDVRKKLALDQATIRKIQDIYRKRSADLKATGESFTKQSAILDEMTRAAIVDDGAYGLQVTQVEALRMDIIKSRTVMLYQIYKQLQPEQRQKLWSIFDARRDRMMEAARERDRASSGTSNHSGK